MNNPNNIRSSFQFIFILACTISFLIMLQYTLEINRKIQHIEKLQSLYYKQLDLSIAEAREKVESNRSAILKNREETLKNREVTMENRKFINKLKGAR